MTTTTHVTLLYTRVLDNAILPPHSFTDGCFVSTQKRHWPIAVLVFHHVTTLFAHLKIFVLKALKGAESVSGVKKLNQQVDSWTWILLDSLQDSDEHQSFLMTSLPLLSLFLAYITATGLMRYDDAGSCRSSAWRLLVAQCLWRIVIGFGSVSDCITEMSRCVQAVYSWLQQYLLVSNIGSIFYPYRDYCIARVNCTSSLSTHNVWPPANKQSAYNGACDVNLADNASSRHFIGCIVCALGVAVHNAVADGICSKNAKLQQWFRFTWL